MFNIDNRGQIGIGTLIVFIAMVLVAAIAAGVIIQSASTVQEQARETSQDSIDSVSNGIWVESMIGESATNSRTIETVRIQYTKVPGSDTVNLNNATWIVESNGKTDTMNTSDDFVTLNSITSISQEGKLEENEDVIETEINLSSSSVNELQQDSELIIISNPPEGNQWKKTRKAPSFIPKEKSSMIL